MNRMSLLSVSFVTVLALSGILLARAQSNDSEAAKGKKIFEDHCAVCHYADNTKTKVGPGLKGLFQKSKMKMGAPVTDSNVRGIIDNGHDGMPAWKDVLTKSQTNELMAYLKTL